MTKEAWSRSERREKNVRRIRSRPCQAVIGKVKEIQETGPCSRNGDWVSESEMRKPARSSNRDEQSSKLAAIELGFTMKPLKNFLGGDLVTLVENWEGPAKNLLWGKEPMGVKVLGVGELLWRLFGQKTRGRWHDATD